MIKFDIKNRFTGVVKFTAEIECDENETRSTKVGLAVSWSIKHAADLTDADLTDADLTRANLIIPFVANLDLKILAAINGGGKLEMGCWHSCETTHCRAGWTCVIAGYAGEILESKIGVECAARLIYEKSRPGIPCPNFYADNDSAMDDLKESAAKYSTK